MYRILLTLAAFAMISSACNSGEDQQQKEQLEKCWDEVVKAWGDVTSSYEKRADLAGNLLNTIRSQTGIDPTLVETLNAALLESKEKNIAAEKLTSESIQEYQNAQANLNAALNNVFVQTSDLEIAGSIRNMQDQLGPVENEINKAYREYNSKVASYNALIEDESNHKDIAFKAEGGADKSPNQDFN